MPPVGFRLTHLYYFDLLIRLLTVCCFVSFRFVHAVLQDNLSEMLKFGAVWSSVAFDRGGQTGPPRSNAFVFGAADDCWADRLPNPELV